MLVLHIGRWQCLTYPGPPRFPSRRAGSNAIAALATARSRPRQPACSPLASLATRYRSFARRPPLTPSHTASAEREEGLCHVDLPRRFLQLGHVIFPLLKRVCTVIPLLRPAHYCSTVPLCAHPRDLPQALTTQLPTWCQVTRLLRPRASLSLCRTRSPALSLQSVPKRSSSARSLQLGHGAISYKPLSLNTAVHSDTSTRFHTCAHAIVLTASLQARHAIFPRSPTAVPTRSSTALSLQLLPARDLSTRSQQSGSHYSVPTRLHSALTTAVHTRSSTRSHYSCLPRDLPTRSRSLQLCPRDLPTCAHAIFHRASTLRTAVPTRSSTRSQYQLCPRDLPRRSHYRLLPTAVSSQRALTTAVAHAIFHARVTTSWPTASSRASHYSLSTDLPRSAHTAVPRDLTRASTTAVPTRSSTPRSHYSWCPRDLPGTRSYAKCAHERSSTRPLTTAVPTRSPRALTQAVPHDLHATLHYSCAHSLTTECAHAIFHARSLQLCAHSDLPHSALHTAVAQRLHAITTAVPTRSSTPRISLQLCPRDLPARASLAARHYSCAHAILPARSYSWGHADIPTRALTTAVPRDSPTSDHPMCQTIFHALSLQLCPRRSSTRASLHAVPTRSSAALTTAVPTRSSTRAHLQLCPSALPAPSLQLCPAIYALHTACTRSFHARSLQLCHRDLPRALIQLVPRLFPLASLQLCPRDLPRASYSCAPRDYSTRPHGGGGGGTGGCRGPAHFPEALK
ncbi:hypothetical protein FKM82_024960 [Ascaphus truei]